MLCFILTDVLFLLIFGKSLTSYLKTCDDFDWLEMFHKGMLGKLNVLIVELFLRKHQLVHGKMPR